MINKRTAIGIILRKKVVKLFFNDLVIIFICLHVNVLFRMKLTQNICHSEKTIDLMHDFMHAHK